VRHRLRQTNQVWRNTEHS